MTRPARLLAVTTSYPLRPHSAAGIFVRRLYEHLPAGWSVEVVCPGDTGVPEPHGAGGVDVRAVRYAPRRWQLLSQGAGGIVPALREDARRWLLVPALLAALALRTLRSARRADLIHANWAVCGLVAVFAGLLARRPVVTTLRGDDVSGRSRIDRWMLDLVVRRSARTVCVSDAMAARLRERYPRQASRIGTCRNGVDARFLAVQRSGARAGRLRIAVVASLVRRKGIDLLLDAVAQAGGRSGMSLHVAGDGPERQALQARAERLGIGSQVEWRGELAPPRIPDFLAETDLYVMCSRSEGRPNVVVEALASALPVLSADLPGIAGLVVDGDNGWVVPAEDARAIAAALDQALRDPGERVRRGHAARERILAAGETWEATGRCYDAVFRAALGRDGEEYDRCAA